jgi:hypothetical protein
MHTTRLFVLVSTLAALEAPAQRGTPIPVVPRTIRTPAATGAPPAALTATGTPSTATISWQWPAGATGFDVFRALAPSGNWAKLTAAPIAVTSFNDGSGFAYGQAYLYRVVALYADGSYGNADVAFQPPAPVNPAWVKATQQGSSVTVSWASVPGASRYIVAGASAADGREIQAPGTSVTYQNVAAGSHRWIVGARFDPGAVETPAAQWPAALLVVTPASARYRVLITGASVVRKSADDPLHYDGIDDEVFFAAQSLVLDRQSGAVVGKQVSKSMNFGDVNNPPRVQAGTASNHGGLLSGDRLPAGDPTQPSGQVTSSVLPLLVFDGTLTDGRDDVLIFPSIWETDHGNGTLYNDWLTKVPQMRASTTAAPDPVPGSSFPVFMATGELVYTAQLGWNWQDDIRLDRPLGSAMGTVNNYSSGLGGNVNTYHYQPRVIVLRREELESRLATPFVASNGAKGIQLSIGLKEEVTRYLLADYVLHLWIERLP